MSIEVIIAVIALIGVLITAVGLILAWKRNGTHQAERDITHAARDAEAQAVSKTNQQAIISRLDDKLYGLQAVNMRIGSLTERVDGHDREIKELKGNRKR
tara:strand:+ start:452 stop:751 length:300 start_codon:yes stop_codon:yes gene_type:complete